MKNMGEDSETKSEDGSTAYNFSFTAVVDASLIKSEQVHSE